MTKALSQSILIHSLIVLFFGLTMMTSKRKIVETFNFEIIEQQAISLKKSPKIVINGAKVAPSKKSVTKKTREVFGVKRKTLTSTKGSVEAKIGNTLTKKEDNRVLRDDESDRLPSPAEEFLITSMPRAMEEVRPDYPLWAKEQKISGSVIFEILIDDLGKVRKATLLRGLNPQLDKLAKEAIMKFKFKPAYIEKKPAAVKIKYAIKYILES
jgi:protein TonB